MPLRAIQPERYGDLLAAKVADVTEEAAAKGSGATTRKPPYR